jgi:hypothetical protein
MTPNVASTACCHRFSSNSVTVAYLTIAGMFIMFINHATDVAMAPTYCSNGAFVECLAGVLQLLSIFVILDAFCEYTSTTRTPSAPKRLGIQWKNSLG